MTLPIAWKEQFKESSDIELDALVAQYVYGWIPFSGKENIPDSIAIRSSLEPHYKRVWANANKTVREACDECGTVPRWSSDCALAFDMEAKIPEQLQRKYLERLAVVIHGTQTDLDHMAFDEIWGLWAATPRDRVIAAILATAVFTRRGLTHPPPWPTLLVHD